MNKYKPALSKERQKIFSDITEKSENIAKAKHFNYVTREISLYILMESSENLIEEIAECGMNAVSFYHELYFKHCSIDFSFNQDDYDDDYEPEEEWKKHQKREEKPKLIKPDVPFLATFGKNLADEDLLSIDEVYWATFKETIMDAYAIADEDEQDYYITDLMDKYLLDPKKDRLFVDEFNLIKFKSNDNDITEEEEEEEIEPKRKWKFSDLWRRNKPGI